MSAEYHSPALILGEILRLESYIEDDEGVDFPYFVDNQPVKPKNLISFYNSDEVLQGKTSLPTVFTKPVVQIRIRSDSSMRAHEKLVEICGYLDSIKNYPILIDEVNYIVQNCSRYSGIFPLGQTVEKLFEFTVNYKLTLRRR